MILPSHNIQVELYCNRLKPKKLTTIQQAIQAVAAEFFNAFKLPPSPSASQETFRVYLFDRKEDYQYFGGKDQFKWGLGSEGGKAYYRGQPEVHSELYLYQQGDTLNLKHELTHALTFYATGGHSRSIPTWLIEGVAEYFEHQKGVVHVSQEESRGLTSGALKTLNYSKDPEKNSLLYRMGHAVVSYLQDQYPQLLSYYFSSLGSRNSGEAESLLEQAVAALPALKHWLHEHSLEKLFQESNVLEARPKKLIGTQERLVGHQVKNISYHQAAITTNEGQTVGRFSPIMHLWTVNTVRAINRATDDYLDIPEDYSFLKVLKRAGESLQLSYCNQQGQLYVESLHYKEQVLHRTFDQVPVLQEHYQALREDERRAAVNYRAYHKACKNTQLFEETCYRDFFESTAVNRDLLPALELKKVRTIVDEFKLLLQIAPHQLTEIEPQAIQNWARNNQILSLRTLGAGDQSALTLYDDSSHKVAELSTETGFFQRTDNPRDFAANKVSEEFIYEDYLKGLNQTYRTPQLAVTQTGNGYRLAFIEDKSLQGDRHFAEPHFHQNELLQPGLQHIEVTDLQPLLLKGQILNHAESPEAHYSEEQRQNGIIVESGELLDNKGTQRTDDDNYAAVVKQGEQLLHHFTNTGFYITEEIKNNQGEVTKPSSLFIHDHGRNWRWQLPEAITHLKLLTNPVGERKLVPCEANGNEFPEGMPDISEEYRLIDPLFAHRYAKQDHSHQHITIDLVNFDSYPDGTRFAIQYDPKDVSIRLDKQVNIVRENNRKTYFTKVKLWYGNQEIGMLSNNFHNFTGKIFFSADLNYSYTDFLASVSPQVVVETTADGGKKISFNRGPGDLGGTDRGYTDHAVIFDRASAPQRREQLAASMASLREPVGVGDRALEKQQSSSGSYFNRGVVRPYG